MKELKMVNCKSLISLKISIISTIAMWCVVGIHCRCGSQIEEWFIPLFFTWGGPWFFFLSGVLLTETSRRKSVLVLLRGKCRSLLLPYLLWCLFGAVISGEWSVDSLRDVFGLTSGSMSPRGNVTLWYVRALMFFMMIGAFICKYMNRFRTFTSRAGLGLLFFSYR